MNLNSKGDGHKSIIPDAPVVNECETGDYHPKHQYSSTSQLDKGFVRLALQSARKYTVKEAAGQSVDQLKAAQGFEHLAHAKSAKSIKCEMGKKTGRDLLMYKGTDRFTNILFDNNKERPQR